MYSVRRLASEQVVWEQRTYLHGVSIVLYGVVALLTAREAVSKCGILTELQILNLRDEHDGLYDVSYDVVVRVQSGRTWLQG